MQTGQADAVFVCFSARAFQYELIYSLSFRIKKTIQRKGRNYVLLTHSNMINKYMELNRN